MNEIAPLVQLGGLGAFAYILLRHVLKGSNELAIKLHNHMEADNKIQHSIYKGRIRRKN